VEAAAPTKLEASNWPKLGVIGAGTFLLMQVDQPIRDEVLKDQRCCEGVLMEFGRTWEELFTPVLLFGGFAAHSQSQKKP